MPRTQTLTLPITADTGITSVRDHTTESNGAGPTTALRQNQNWSGFDKKLYLFTFDTGALKNRRVERAWFHVTVPRGELHAAGFCTMLSPWEEGAAHNFDVEHGASSWSWRRTPGPHETPTDDHWWAGPGSDISAVAWSNLALRYSHAGPGDIQSSPAENGQSRHLRIPIAPALIEAVAAGISNGLILSDDKGQVAEARSLKGDAYPYRFNEAEDIWIYTRHIPVEELQPYVEVRTRRAGRAVPGRITRPRVTDVDSPAGRAVITFAAPRAGREPLAAYEVVSSNRPVTASSWENAQPIPQWAVVKPVDTGDTQDLPVFTVGYGSKYIGIRGISPAGARGPVTSVKVAIPRPRVTPLRLPKPKVSRRTKQLTVSDVTIAAVPDLAKVDPVNGLLLLEGNAYRKHDAYLAGNSVWNAGKRTVTLSAAANEVVAFQIILGRTGRRKLTNCRVALGDLTSAATKGRRPTRIRVSDNARHFRVWYVHTEDDADRPLVGPNAELIEDRTVRPSGWHGEICLPMDDPSSAGALLRRVDGHPDSFDVPAADNDVAGQRYQSVWVDLHVPRGAKAGRYTGELTVTADQLRRPVALSVSLQVYAFAIPDDVRWTVELNRYNSPLRYLGVDPAKPGTDQDRACELLHDFYRIAHSHRTALTVLPYSQSGTIDGGIEYMPETKGSGTSRRISDWTRFDKWMGPLLDGSAFTREKGYVGPRQNVPITHHFLPFHENWPMPLNRSTYDDFANLNDREAFAKWAAKSKLPEKAFSRAFAAGYRAVVNQYFRHMNRKGYTKTDHFFFFNNKYYFKVGFFSRMGFTGSSFWLLDEPVDYDDYEINRYLFQLCHDGVEKAGGKAQARYRVDISQPDMARGLFDGTVDAWMIGGRRSFNTGGAIRKAMGAPELHWSYGGGSGISAPLVNNTNHALLLWCLGDTGYMPWWNTFSGGGRQHWKQGETLAVFYRGQDYPGRRGTYKGPLASVRMKAVRRMQQDIEYLQVLAESKGWSRGLVRLAIRHLADDPEASVLSFRDLSQETLEGLREVIASKVMTGGRR